MAMNQTQNAVIDLAAQGYAVQTTRESTDLQSPTKGEPQISMDTVEVEEPSYSLTRYLEAANLPTVPETINQQRC